MPRAWTRLEDPHAARLALNPAYTDLLRLLMTREWTAAPLAAAALFLVLRALLRRLPLPVAPAMRRWGIFPRSVTTGVPMMSFPRAMVRREADF